VSAFDSFTIEDAGGDKGASKDSSEDASKGAESTGSTTSSSTSASEGDKSTPKSEESTSTGSRLQTSLDRETISPKAKKLALEKGVSINNIKGTGPGGRITVQDVEKSTGTSTSAAAGGPGVATYEDTPATSMRKTIAARLTQSVNQNPHYFVASTVSVTKLLKLRAALNGSANGKYKLSVNDFLVKAAAIACRRVPAANSSWREEGGQVFIRQNNVVDISVAVATPAGLMTPIVKNVNGIGLESISAQVKELGKRARDGKLKPDEYQGGTFTISNLGMNDAIDRFTAVINPPQAAILAVGTTKKVAVPAETEEGTGFEWDDQIVLTGSFDHKVVDGAVGGEFMKELKKVIENPLELLL